MSLARSSAYSAAPIPLRLILALTFIWAGLGKFVATMEVQGEQAALLANMGVSMPAPTPAPTPTSTPAPTPAPALEPSAGDPAEPETDTTTEPAESETPPPASVPAETPDENDAGQPGPSAHADPAAPPAFNPPALVQTALIQADPAQTGQTTTAESTPTTPTHATTSQTYTAADFPDPIELSRLHGLALLTYSAAHPKPDELGTTPSPIWPEWAARDHWPVTLAWAAAITELVAAVLVLVGLLTRLSALSIASVMITAAWLTEFGPAIQSGDTLLGFLPNRPLWDPASWSTLLWQLCLIAAALSLALAGPGALSLDRALTGGASNDDYEDDED